MAPATHPTFKPAQSSARAVAPSKNKPGMRILIASNSCK